MAHTIEGDIKVNGRNHVIIRQCVMSDVVMERMGDIFIIVENQTLTEKPSYRTRSPQ